MPDWSAARKLVPVDPDVVMLNTGSFGPTPTPVFDRATELRRQLAAGPTDFFVRRVPPLLWHARERTAAFLGTTPERLVFASNVSVAINLIANGLRLDSPGEILMSDHEYGAMEWCWERFAERHGLTVRKFPLPTMPSDPGEIVDAAATAMTPRTRLLFVSHVLSPNGMILPAKELCTVARQRGVMSVVDGAHAPAQIPLNVTDVGADFYTGNLHKWLLAPIGAGFLVIGPGNEDRLQPSYVSWGYKNEAGIGPDAQDAFGSTPRTRFLEFDGTRDVCPWLAVPDAIDFQANLGWDAIRGRHAELAAYCRKVIPLKPAVPSALGGSMTAFEMPPGHDAHELRKKLWDRRIEIPVNVRPDHLLLRVSHHFYTTEAEIDVLAKALPEVL